MIYQNDVWVKTKSWKLDVCEVKTNIEYKTVIKISNEIICTKPRTVPIIAYLDWESSPTIEKKIFESKINIKWYKIIESTESTKNKLGPQIKFKEKSSWVPNSNDKKIGAITVAGRGIRKISFVSILNKSAKIWNAPFRPINVGPIRRCANAKSFRSVKTTNKVSSTTNNEDNKTVSCINKLFNNNLNSESTGIEPCHYWVWINVVTILRLDLNL